MHDFKVGDKIEAIENLKNGYSHCDFHKGQTRIITEIQLGIFDTYLRFNNEDMEWSSSAFRPTTAM